MSKLVQSDNNTSPSVSVTSQELIVITKKYLRVYIFYTIRDEFSIILS